MPYTIKYHKAGFVEFKYTGTITQQEAVESSVEGITLAKKNGVQLYLADHSESEMVLPIEQVQDLMDKLAGKTDVSRNAKLAVVRPTVGGQTRDNLESFGTFASNQGWMVSVFDTYQEAIDWLTA